MRRRGGATWLLYLIGLGVVAFGIIGFVSMKPEKGIENPGKEVEHFVERKKKDVETLNSLMSIEELREKVKNERRRLADIEKGFNALPNLHELETKLIQLGRTKKATHKETGVQSKHFDNSAIMVGDPSSLKESAPLHSVSDSKAIAKQLGTRPSKKQSHSISFERSYLAKGGNNPNVCTLASSEKSSAKITVEEMYERNPFNDPEGGAWKQGFEISYNPKEWDDSPLRVWVVPHSHNDPGWIHTVDEYFNRQTKNILDNVIQTLSESPDRTFIWAEISYFAMWWDTASGAKRDTAKRLLENKQLEIVTGGWVMPDEANTHYFAIVDQLVEGHMWLEENVGVKPSTAWSIDPFGHSPTMAYILKRTGMEGMIIQRVHYEVKRMLAETKNLEFMWTQTWDHGQQETDMFCSMMPFFSYDVPHTCGPDPKICCQFDFARLPGGKYTCPWRVPPRAITDANVHERATMLIDQYRKKSKLFKSKNVLIPLGDDFRYDNNREVQYQFNNYEKLFKHMNSHPDFKAEVRFGTLSDYFTAVNEERLQNKQAYDTLSGDFFTYADRQDNYWSGYFTSRPFYKHLDRELEAAIRAAEILFSFVSNAKSAALSANARERILSMLVQNRRNLGFFQHHDGITGTAKDHVVVDYGQRLLKAMKQSQSVISELGAHVLLSDKATSLKAESHREVHDGLPERTKIIVTASPKAIVVHNPLSHVRDQTISIIVSDHSVKITGPDGSMVPSQANPVWLDGVLSQDSYEVWFTVTVPALGLATYHVERAQDSAFAPVHKHAEIFSANGQYSLPSVFKQNDINHADIQLESGKNTMTFDGSSGLLKTIRNEHGSTKVSIQFMVYRTGRGRDRHSPSGAYLFMPEGPAMPLRSRRHTYHIVKGPVMHQVFVDLGSIKHTVRLFPTSRLQQMAISIENIVDARGHDNEELTMRILTDVDNRKVFFTDLNGFQMRKRITMDKLPMGGNFFPLPGMGYLEDTSKRVTLHARSAHGCSALENGWIEVVLDRRLSQDDNRGLFQPMQDNKITLSNFILNVEHFETDHTHPADLPLSATSFPSLYSQIMNDYLNYPLYSMVPISDVASPAPSWSPLGDDVSLPCELHMVNFRTVAHEHGSMLLSLHRKGHDCGISNQALEFCKKETTSKIDLSKILKQVAISSIKECSLTRMHYIERKEYEKDSSTDVLKYMNPMEIYAWDVRG
eukprot:m.146168 g.146168  ORF g.146168 m.146168 type:complete len:1199 (+) comp14965_c0_seq2:71-3667(+)